MNDPVLTILSWVIVAAIVTAILVEPGLLLVLLLFIVATLGFKER